MGLREEIKANPACAAAIAARDCDTIAQIMSVGRTRPSAREIGNGTILEVLAAHGDMDSANVFLDVLYTEAKYRHVKPLIEQGRLKIGSPLVQATVRSMVPAIITAAQADALCAVGLESATLSAQDVAEALFNPDGTEK